MSVPLCYYGSPQPLPPRRELRAGPLALTYEAGDLRYVRLGDREVIRRWYVAVRDRNWGTVPATRTNERFEVEGDSFRVTYDAEHREQEVHFIWRATIAGAADGTVTFTMDGEAHSTFLRNRIGFCLLHPIRECAGARCRLESADGTVTEETFPRFIAPHNPFRELRALAHEVSPGLWAELRFEGDLFETEDQRNWTDASYKTFCTPLRLPFPVEVRAGTRVRQSVTLTLTGAVPATPAGRPEPVLAVSATAGAAMPEIGVCATSHGRPLSGREVEVLRHLRPAHLRVELDLTSADWADRLRQAASEARALGAGLEAAVTVSDRARDETAELVRVLHAENPAVRRVLVFHDREWATPERVLMPVIEALARYDASVPVYAGTTANFLELNRGRPPLDRLGGVCYSVQPQEHAFDNASLVECCAAIADTVASARQFCGDRPLAVTPVTLRKRVNPYATGPAPPVPPGELPPTVDRRQMSLFGAAWTLGSLKYLAEAGVASATYYETTGWRGVMELADGCSLPEQFPSRSGMVFPLFHVLADANEFAGGEVLAAVSSDPLVFDGLAIRRGETTRVMLANMTDRPQLVTVTGLAPEAVVRVLDEATFDRATQDDPLGFQRRPGEPWLTKAGTLKVKMNPYAYVRIDSD